MSGGLYSMDQKDFDQTLDLTRVKPYGDTMNDGKTQLSFTLPVPCGDEAVEAANDTGANIWLTVIDYSDYDFAELTENGLSAEKEGTFSFDRYTFDMYEVKPIQ